MSSANLQPTENHEFVARLIEVCKTDRPSDIQHLLNIQYQTARNYLNGRLPATDILIRISENLGCSIDWLLTGRGKKFIVDRRSQSTEILARQMEPFFRKVCMEVINEKIGTQEVDLKVVKLQSSKLMSERTVDESVVDPRILTGSQR